MTAKIIVDRNPTNVTTATTEPYPWFRFDAERFILEEGLIGGNYLNLHFSGMGRPTTRERINLRRWRAQATVDRHDLQSFQLDVDGQSLYDHWVWESEQQSKTADGYDLFTLVLRDELRPVRIKIQTLLDGTSFLERWLEIENVGSKPFNISKIFPWCGLVYLQGDLSMTVPDPVEYSIGRYLNQSGLVEGEFVWEKLPEGTLQESTRKLVKFAPSFYLVRNDSTGEVLVLDVEYSGPTCVEFKRIARPAGQNHLVARVGLAGSAPFRVVAPGETVKTPRVHLSMVMGDADACSAELFKHLRQSVLPKRNFAPKHPVGYHYGGYMNPVWQTVTCDIIRKEVDLAAAFGAELFMVDAGWNVPPGKSYVEVFGQWTENERLENGLRGCFDYARSKGLQAGLWAPIEIVGRSSEVFLKHPEWCLRDGERQVLMLDITKPEVEEHVFNSIVTLIEKYDLACFRIDGGAELYCAWDHQDGERVENRAWRYYEALYRIFERVHARFPKIMLENCWGGGGRIDLGMMRRFHWVQYSDNWHPEEQLRMLNGLVLAMPPEQCISWIGAINMNPSDLDFVVRAGLFGQFYIAGVAPHLDKLNQPALDRWKHAVELYKTRIRPTLSECVIHRHTPVQRYRTQGEWVVLEYAAKDASSATVGFFRLANGNNDTFHWTPRGLDMSRNYTVWFDNHSRSVTISGTQLCTSGLSIRIPGVLQSELLVIES